MWSTVERETLLCTLHPSPSCTSACTAGCWALKQVLCRFEDGRGAVGGLSARLQPQSDQNRRSQQPANRQRRCGGRQRGPTLKRKTRDATMQRTRTRKTFCRTTGTADSLRRASARSVRLRCLAGILPSCLRRGNHPQLSPRILHRPRNLHFRILCSAPMLQSPSQCLRPGVAARSESVGCNFVVERPAF